MSAQCQPLSTVLYASHPLPTPQSSSIYYHKEHNLQIGQCDEQCLFCTWHIQSILSIPGFKPSSAILELHLNFSGLGVLNGLAFLMSLTIQIQGNLIYDEGFVVT